MRVIVLRLPESLHSFEDPYHEFVKVLQERGEQVALWTSTVGNVPLLLQKTLICTNFYLAEVVNAAMREVENPREVIVVANPSGKADFIEAQADPSIPDGITWVFLEPSEAATLLD